MLDTAHETKFPQFNLMNGPQLIRNVKVKSY